MDSVSQDHQMWCENLDPHEPSEGCEADLGIFHRGDLYVTAGVLRGQFHIACEVRNSELVADMETDDLSDLVDMLALGLQLVRPNSPAVPSSCVLCGARLKHTPECGAGAQ